MFRRLSAVPLLLCAAVVVAQPPSAEKAPTPRAPGAPLSAVPAEPAPAANPEAVALDRKVIAEVKANTKLMDNLQYLSDVIGGRVTGTPALEKANKWAAEKMTEYGLTDVKLEPWEIPVGWERGTASLKLVEPNNGKVLTVAARAWTPGTNGKVTGPIVYLNARTQEELAKYKGKLKNAVVLRSPPAPVLPITDPSYLGGGPKKDPKKDDKKDEPKKTDDKTTEPKKEPVSTTGGARADEQPPFGGGFGALQQQVNDLLRDEGIACTITDSGAMRKPHGHLGMTGNWPTDARLPKPLPNLFVTPEHYAMLYRLATAKYGFTPKCEVEISNKFIPGPVTVYNTVGEIKGSEKPDEFVVLGAHLDSWDLGTGTTDNGTGSCIVLEVARTLGALAKQGIKPKRTIRFVLFTGEEQGLYGSKEYVKKHKDEMPKTSMCLVHDTGTGIVQGISLGGLEEVRKVLEPELVTLKEVAGWKALNMRAQGGTDHLSFRGTGVPGLCCDQEGDEYRYTHHTQVDTFDRAKAPNLNQGATVMAVTALRVANLPDLLPRDTARPKGKFGGGEPKKGEEPKKTEDKKDEPKKTDK